MIRTNLATRPFYNEAAVRIWLAVIAIFVVSLTIFNIQRLLYYSSSDTELATQASRDENQAVDLRADARRLRASVDTTQVEAASTEAREANDLIDRRTFSWTELFNRFESTLPAEVRITSLRQTLDRNRGTVLTVSVLSRSVEDVNQFMENLSATHAFADLLVTDERVDPDNGQLQVLLQAVYRPASAEAPAATGAGRGTP